MFFGGDQSSGWISVTSRRKSKGKYQDSESEDVITQFPKKIAKRIMSHSNVHGKSSRFNILDPKIQRQLNHFVEIHEVEIENPDQSAATQLLKVVNDKYNKGYQDAKVAQEYQKPKEIEKSPMKLAGCIDSPMIISQSPEEQNRSVGVSVDNSTFTLITPMDSSEECKPRSSKAAKRQSQKQDKMKRKIEQNHLYNQQDTEMDLGSSETFEDKSPAHSKEIVGYVSMYSLMAHKSGILYTIAPSVEEKWPSLVDEDYLNRYFAVGKQDETHYFFHQFPTQVLNVNTTWAKSNIKKKLTGKNYSLWSWMKKNYKAFDDSNFSEITDDKEGQFCESSEYLMLQDLWKYLEVEKKLSMEIAICPMKSETNLDSVNDRKKSSLAIVNCNPWSKRYQEELKLPKAPPLLLKVVDQSTDPLDIAWDAKQIYYHDNYVNALTETDKKKIELKTYQAEKEVFQQQQAKNMSILATLEEFSSPSRSPSPSFETTSDDDTSVCNTTHGLPLSSTKTSAISGKCTFMCDNSNLPITSEIKSNPSTNSNSFKTSDTRSNNMSGDRNQSSGYTKADEGNKDSEGESEDSNHDSEDEEDGNEQDSANFNTFVDDKEDKVVRLGDIFHLPLLTEVQRDKFLKVRKAWLPPMDIAIDKNGITTYVRKSVFICDDLPGVFIWSKSLANRVCKKLSPSFDMDDFFVDFGALECHVDFLEGYDEFGADYKKKDMEHYQALKGKYYNPDSDIDYNFLRGFRSVDLQINATTKITGVSVPTSLENEATRRHLSTHEYATNDMKLNSVEEKSKRRALSKKQYDLAIEQTEAFTTMLESTFDITQPHWQILLKHKFELLGLGKLVTCKRGWHKRFDSRVSILYGSIIEKYTELLQDTEADSAQRDCLVLLMNWFHGLLFHIGPRDKKKLRKATTLLKGENPLQVRLRNFTSLNWSPLFKDVLEHLNFKGVNTENAEEVTSDLIRKAVAYAPKGDSPSVKLRIAAPSKTMDDKYRLADTYFEEGEVGCAKRVITQDYVPIPNNGRFWDKLKSKFPDADLNESFPAEEATKKVKPLVLTPEQVCKAVQTAPKLRAAGINGIRYEHLKRLIDGSPAMAPVLTKFYNCMLSGLPGLPKDQRSHHYSFLTGSGLVALLKGEVEDLDADVRPVGVGDVHRRVINRAVQLAIKDKITAHFEPYQLGINQPAGVEVMTEAMKVLGVKYPKRVFIKLDIRNAFNTPHISKILQEVATHFPELYPWVYAMYRYPSRLYTTTDSYHRAILEAKRGVQQGDAMGPFLFDLALHPLLCSLNKDILKDGRDGVAFAFHDDIIIQVTRESLSFVMSSLEQLCGDLGLEFNKVKCEVYSPDMDMSEDEKVAIESQSFKLVHDTKVVGTPLGSRKYQRLYIWKKIQDLRKDINLLKGWQNTHGLIQVFRLCICTKLTYLFRTIDEDIWRPLHSHQSSQLALPFLNITEEYLDDLDLLVYVDEMLREALSSFLGSKELMDYDHSWRQAKLKPKSGGCGIPDGKTVAMSARLASKVFTHSRVEKLIGVQYNNAAFEEVTVLLNEQCDALQKLNPSKAAELGETLFKFSSNTPKLQSLLYQFHDALTYERLRMTNTSIGLRVDSSGAEGGFLITHIPKQREMVIPPKVYKGLLKLRLGLPIFSKPFICPKCGEGCDRFGLHPWYNCRMGNYRQVKHNAAIKAWCDLFRKAGHLVRTEVPPVMTCEATRSRMDIMSAEGFDGYKGLGFDVTITASNVLADSNITPPPGKAAFLAEQGKNRKYLPIIDLREMEFYPLAMEALGRWGQSARAVFKRYLEIIGHENRSVLSAFWKAKITLSHMVVAMRDLLQRMRIEDDEEDEDDETSVGSGVETQVMSSGSVEDFDEDQEDGEDVSFERREVTFTRATSKVNSGSVDVSGYEIMGLTSQEIETIAAMRQK